MSDYPPPYPTISPPVNDFVGGVPTDNVVHQPPPSYGFLNPAALENTGTKAPQYQPQVGGYPGSPSATYGVPMMINPELNQIEEYTAWSVINILFCCCCLGLVACYYSVEAGNAKKMGDIQSALNASRTARTINIIATILGPILSVICVLQTRTI